jgi:hypothetical protein
MTRLLTAIASLTVLILTGCAAPAIDPSALSVPKQAACVRLDEPLIVSALYGPFSVQWTTRLERGLYWSERVDKSGTYYRAPTGGVSVVGKDGKGFPGQPTTMNGGFYVPHNGSDPIYLYWYFSTAVVDPVVPSVEENCSAFRLTRDASTPNAIPVPAAMDDASVDAIGQRTTQPLAGSGPRQTAVAGAVGGALGVGIVDAMIRAGIGKISIVLPPVKDSVFLGKLRTLENGKVSVPEVRSNAGAGMSTGNSQERTEK